VKLNEALDKLGYSNDQISQYLNGKTKTIGAPPAKQTNQQSGQQALAVRSQLGKVTSSDLSAALSAERQKLGLKGGETLSDSQVSSVYGSLKDMRRSANPIQSKPLQKFGAAVGIGK
jgi:hypothetical protein